MAWNVQATFIGGVSGSTKDGGDNWTNDWLQWIANGLMFLRLTCRSKHVIIRAQENFLVYVNK